jgi:DNA-binding beta-propeller fold protein YncE
MIAVGNDPEGIAASPGTSTLAVAVRGGRDGTGSAVELLDAATGALRHLVAFTGDARHLELAGPDGPLLVPDEAADRLIIIGLPGGRVLGSVRVGRQPHDAAADTGEYLVGNELGNTADLIVGGRVRRFFGVPRQPGGVAAVAGDFVVVGVRARVVAAYRPDGRLVAEAVAGTGPTHVVAGASGWFFVADTLGDRVLIYRLQGSVLRRAGHVSLPGGSRPYGLAARAVSPTETWLFVTLTGTNQLVGLRFAGAEVIARDSWPTGRQPNSVAVDPSAGAIAVTASASNQVELIPSPPDA